MADIRTDTIHSSPKATAISLKGFSASDIQFFQSLLKQYSYGKDLNGLLQAQTKFSASYKRNRQFPLILNNFIDYDACRGVCGELAHSYAKKALANARIQSKYDIHVVTGGNASIFSEGHAFLIAAPKRLNLRTTLKAQPKDTFPEGSLLIDPSLSVIEKASGSKYNFGGSQIYVDAKLMSGVSHAGYILKPDEWSYSVVGFVKDYLPRTNIPNNSLLYLGFQIASTNDNTPTVELFTQECSGRPMNSVNLESLDQGLDIVKFIGKIRNDLTTNHK